MAVDLLSEGPRLSFSEEFLSDGEQRNLLSNSSPSSSALESGFDFDFCRFDGESSSADELFADGKILPIQIKKKEVIIKQSKPPPLSTFEDSGNRNQDSQTVILKEEKNAINDDQKRDPKSFWHFSRSSSLNCVSSFGRTVCSLPLLSRSNSTGSVPTAKRSHPRKYNYKDFKKMENKEQIHGFKQQHNTPSQQQSSSWSYHHKPPLKKNYGSSYSQNPNGCGVRVSPVLNVTPSTILGFGSFFNAKDCKSKKKL